MKLLKNIHRQESGQMLILASLLLLLSGLIVVPLVSYINTGIKSTMTYQNNNKNIYAADSGYQYAMWEIVNDPQVISDRAANKYIATYNYAPPSVNNNTVTVQVNSNWLFAYLFNINLGDTPHDSNLITTCTADNGTFTISFENISNNPFVIQEFGVWLPHGFSYVAGSAGQFQNNIDLQDPTSNPIFGGTNIIWNFGNNGYSLNKNSSASEIFKYDPADVTMFGDASWVMPQQQSVGVSWDNAVWWYSITSTATNISTHKVTEVDSIVTYNEGTPPQISTIIYQVSP